MDYTTLSQRNPLWSSKKLGFSKLSIFNYGCTLTTLTNLLNRVFGYSFTPDMVNDRLKSVNAFSGALIIWAKVSVAYPELKFVCRDWNYNNTKVAWYVYIKKLPVMVEVNASKIGAARHWVLFIGNQKCVDPWTGTIISTGTYPLTGDAIYTK
jgi:hypothetical protein